MAAAVILIPEMLSGPDREPHEAARPVTDEAPLKTYTIDLNQPVGGHPAGEGGETRAPPPEASGAVAAAPEGKPEDPAAAQRASITPDAPARQTEAGDAVVEPPTQTAQPGPTPEQSQRPVLASPRLTPTSGAWAVQLGSFSRQASAERLTNELRAEGHEAFVMPVRSGAATLYRVRVGPIKDRSAAETALRTLKAKVSSAAVVAHP